jgi:hypothetical protein
MAQVDSGDDGLGAAQARAERVHERGMYELKAAVFRACQALREAGLTEARIVGKATQKGTPLSRSVVAKLTSDGDEQGWRVPSLRTCLVIDAICRDMNVTADLAGRRKALDQAARDLRAAKARDRTADNSRNLSYAQRAAMEGELRDYLAALGRVLAQTPAWLPYRRLDSGFAERLVKVSDEAPVPAPDGGLYREAPPPGTVRWERAIEGVPIAVVLADAGYGKTWQLRRHCLRLCERALAALDSDMPISEVRLPLWVPAGDLARSWPGGGSPAASVAAAATSELRRFGKPVSAELTDFLAGALAVGSVDVLIDAYDEVFNDQLRSSVKQALSWLTEGPRREKAQLILASRQAGYDQPFDLRGDPEEDDAAPGERPYYVHLGPLEESQVQVLWAEWFAARRLPVPDERLQPAVTPNSPLRRFVGVPLVAAFCAWVAEHEEVSSTRTGLYGQVLRRFLGQAWKTDPPAASSARQDGARRAVLEEALVEMAWLMATEQGRWRDSMDVGRCEQILATSGPTVPHGRSHTWELVRQIGILVQEGAEHSLGDGPVLWIHRSVQQFLAARKLVALGSAAAPYVENAWLHPAWGDVLDFAIGMETGQEEGAVTRAVRAAAVGDDDALGWYAGVFAAASAGLPAAPAVRGVVVKRVWRLHRVGLLSPTYLARVLALVAEASSEAVVRALHDRLDDPDTDRSELWRAMAWSGAPGRTLLARLIRESPEAIGAAAALHAVDPAAAVAALRDRVAEDLPVGAADAPVLRELDTAAVALLAERYEAEPESEQRADWLGLTGHPLARQMLSDPRRLRHHAERIRYAAAYGLAGAYGTDIDEAGLRVLLDVALHDPLPELRRRIRSRLQDVAAEVPWVEAALDDVFDQLHADPTQPEITDRESLAPLLRQVGPATHKAVAMLLVEPALIDGPVLEPLLALTERALRGELDQSLTADVARAVAARFGAQTFAEPACAMLRRADEAPAAAGRLAVGLAWAVPGDPEIFDALVACAGGNPHPLTSAALHVYDLPVPMKCDALGRSLLRLAASRPRAVEVWSRALRSLLQQAPQRERQQFRGMCAAATQHLLRLLGEA